RPPARGDADALPARGPGGVQRRVDRHCARERQLRASGRHPPRRGHRALPGQGAGARALRRVRPQHARPGGGAAASGDRSAQVAEVLQSTGLSPRSLRLEVTESLLMDKHPNVAQTMIELRAMGVRIDLDDFGTGYSSLSYLHQFPIDTLKIDRSFVQRMGATDDALEIVNTILALANSLDMEAVAEVVKTVQQLELLRKTRCSYAQGYHLSRPIEALQF